MTILTLNILYLIGIWPLGLETPYGRAELGVSHLILRSQKRWFQELCLAMT